ncbi:hypothetical protein GR183_17950 [Stappia sp. GBMRC 2046]|uniref:DUF2157 domain-containing protein n=1 Tax=Stappia sediminis TaxID=2692190 RepID=A0A7X3LXE3_9HYPH|nr:hypothetical protein [Stappia sediminis]MXN66801.1 hypothetical protein [Stappia sediminis]
MSISRKALDGAIAKGILSEQQAAQLFDHLRPSPTGDLPEPENGNEDSISAADAEEVRFARGFHDVFVTIGIMIFMYGLLIGLRSISGGSGFTSTITLLGMAAAVWLLAEVFARRLRLALPSIVLNLYFVPLAFLGISGIIDQSIAASFTYAPTLKSIGTHLRDVSSVLPLLLIEFSGLAVAVAFQLRFKVPIGIAIIALIVIAMFVTLLTYFFPNFFLSNFAWVTLAIGLACFACAMRFDVRDPTRKTVNSDKAFWLHLLSAPLIVHSTQGLLGAVFIVNAEGATKVMATVGLIAIVAIIVDRRALLVSSLIYLAYAITVLLQDANLSTDGLLALVLVSLGSVVLMLGSGWSVLRKRVVALFAGTPLVRWLPPTH